MRLIDADKVIADLKAMKDVVGYDAILIESMIEGLKRQETVDAVEIVRCKDCIDFNTDGYEKEDNEDLQCGYCRNWRRGTQACQFCSFGERR